MSAADRPTRMVFADTLTAGQTVIDHCPGGSPCQFGLQHGPGEHDLTILDIRTNQDGGIVAIVVDDDSGAQTWISRGPDQPVRIYVDAPQVTP